MKNIKIIVAILVCVVVGGAAHADQLLYTDQDYQGHVAKNQGVPTTSGNSIRLGDMPGSGLPCGIWFTGGSPLFRCGVLGNAASGADVQAPLAPADGSIVMPTPSTIKVGVVPGTSVSGTPNTAAYFNGSGLLNSLTLAPEFALNTGTLSIATGGITTAKLADGAVTTVKVADGAVTYQKIQNVGANKLLGNPTGSPAPPSEIGVSAPLSLSGTNLQLNFDATLAVAGGLLQRNALSGAVTAAAGSNVTAFGTQTGPSLFGVAAAGTAIPGPILALTANTAATFDGTTVAFRPIGPAATSGIVANWPIGIPRIYAVDTVNGNDANKGYADPVSSSAADVAAATQAAGLVAKKTYTGFGSIFPLQGAGRRAAVVSNQGTYSDSLLAAINGMQGYAQFVARGTGTNATAGVTAFDGSAADLIYVGAVTAPSMNAGGYNPTAGATTTVIPCRINGGGTVTFPAEPGSPVGYRIRFSSSTATAALRNVTAAIVGASGATLTLSNNTALPATPGTGDVFYIEAPGVVTPVPTSPQGFRITGNGLTGFMSNFFVGINMTGLLYPQGDMFLAFSNLGGLSAGNGVPLSIDSTGHTQGLYVYVDGVSFPRVGGAGRIDGFINFDFGDNAISLPAYVLNGTSSPPVAVSDSQSFYVGDGAVVYPRLAIGGKQAGSFAGVTLGGASAIGERPLRIISDGAQPAALSMNSMNGTLGAIVATQAGAHPAIKISGQSWVTMLNLVSGSAGNTDVGVDLTGAFSTTIVLVTQPTVTGTLGDLRLCTGTIVTWAQASAGIVDACGNKVGSSTWAPLTVSTAGTSITGLGTGHVNATSDRLVVDTTTYLPDTGGNGFVIRTGVGTTTNRTLTNTDGTITITNPDGVAGNPIINTTGLTPSSRTVQGTAPISIGGDHAPHDLSANRTWALDANGVTYPFLQQGGPLSIPGRSSNSTGNWADIPVAAGSGGVLRESGSSLGFGTITESVVQNLVSDLASKVPATRTIATAPPLTGGGDLSADRTLGISDFVASGPSHARGAVPDPGSIAGTTRFLREDGWAALAAVAQSGSASDLGTGTLPDARLSNIIGVGSCTNCNITWDAHGRITVATNGSGGGGGTVTAVTATAPIFSSGGTAPNITIQGAIVTGSTSTSAFNLGLIGNGVLMNVVSGGQSTPGIFSASINRIPRGSGSNGGFTESAGLIYDGSTFATTNIEDDGVAVNSIVKTNGSHVLVPASAGTDYVHSVSATNGIVNIGTTADPLLSLVTSGVTAGTYVTPTITVDIYGRVTAASFTNTIQVVESDGVPVTNEATLNFQAPLHAADSGGGPFRTNASLLIDANHTVNGSNQLALANQVGINGVGLPTNAAFVVGHTNNANFDHAQFFVGGGGLEDGPDNTLFLISPANTTVPAGRTSGIWSTLRIGAPLYTGVSLPALTEATTLYIDGAPTSSNVHGLGLYALHIASGGVAFGDLAAGGVVTAATGTGFLRVSPALVASLYYTTRLYTLLNAGELVQGGYSLNPLGSISFTQVEYPTGVAASKVTLSCKYEHATITGGNYTFKAARNGVDTGANLSFASGTPDGTYFSTVSVAGSSTSDTWGLDLTGLGSANNCDPSTSNCPDMMCSILLVP